LSAGRSIAAFGGVANADANVLDTVRIGVAVAAGGTLLPPGTYELRLTGEHPDPPIGQPRNAQEWIEFIKDGKVVAREAAEILYDDDLTPVGASSQKARPGTRVEMLKGGEFLRISVKRERDRYLIYLPVRADSTTS
jgi:hypothetical protein